MAPTNHPRGEPQLLIPKSITSFLLSNLRPFHTLAITTHNGKLLSAATCLPATVLRRQCAIAAALVANSNPFPDMKPKLLAIALENGTAMLVRKLRNGMLLVGLGAYDAPPRKEAEGDAAGVDESAGRRSQPSNEPGNDEGGESKTRCQLSPLSEPVKAQIEAIAESLEESLGALHVPEEGVFAIA